MSRKRSRKCQLKGGCGKEFATLAGKDYHTKHRVCLKAKAEPTTEPAETVAEVPAETHQPPSVPAQASRYRPRMVVGGMMVWRR
jgi:hypothetical protein